jgi:peptidoglycan/xylan/chitin deacetylase (PgdA/CDA1 family)
MGKIYVVWSNDDISFGQADKLTRQIDFIDRYGIKGSFFVVPRGVAKGEKIIEEDGKMTIDKDRELLKVIEKARVKGHRFYQHGYVHTPFECGVPELEMIDFSAEVKRSFSSERFEIEGSHTVEVIAEKIELGKKIWRRAFGEDSEGFRPGWGAYCINYYKSLEVLGFRWASTRIVLWTSWVWGQGNFDFKEGFRKGITPYPYKIGRILEIPIGGDYAFHVKEGDIDRFFSLAVEEFNLSLENNYPFVPVCHWHGLERDGTDTGYKVHEKLIPALLKSGKAEFVTMDEIYKRYSGVKL